MKTKTIFALLLLVVIGCGCQKSNNDTFEKLSFSVLYQGNVSSYDTNSEIVHIASQQDFETWINEFNFHAKESLFSIKTDFTTQQILVVFDTIRNYLPSSINVVEIHKYENRMVVYTQSDLNGLAPALNRGFCIIQIPKISENITIKKEEL